MKLLINTSLRLLAAGALLLSLNTQAQDKPNILLLVAEDLSSRIGAFGDPVANTPHLDNLAAKGIRYTNAYTTAGVCATSRTALITGVHQIEVGGQHMRTRDFKASQYRAVPDAEIKAFPELLRKAGYFTYVSNKLDYQFSEITAKTGPFTIWDYEGGKPSWQHPHRQSDQPFFGMYHFDITHEKQLMPKNLNKNLKKASYKQVTSTEQVTVPDFLPDTPNVRQAIASIYDHVHLMDKQVGNLLQQLKKDGLADNTIVIWTTDHGDPLPRAKREVYDSGIKVPLIVYWPEAYRPKSLVPGDVKDQLLSFVDIAPSILQMAGAQKPGFLHGAAYLAEPELPARQYVFAAKDRIDGVPFRERAVRSADFKYIKNYLPGKPGGVKLAYREQLPLMADIWQVLDRGLMTPGQAFFYQPRPEEELYDLTADPFELNNLAQHPDFNQRLVTMRLAYQEFTNRVDDKGALPELAQAQSSWPNGQQPVTPMPNISNQKGQVTISHTMAGVSMGYKLNQQPWRLYVAPITVAQGDKIQAKAVRYGWAESKVIRL